VASDPERVPESALERTAESPWDAVDQIFFASAPPDIAEPAPEPMRFDDLDDPVAQHRAQHRWLAAAPAWRASVAASARAVRARLAPVGASAAATWRRVTPASMAAVRFVGRTGRIQTARLVTLLRQTDARDRKLFAAAVAALLLVMGVSAGVVASRDSDPPARAVPRKAGAASAVACDARSAPAFSIAADGAREVVNDDERLSPALSIAPDRDPLLSRFSVAPDRAAPGPHARKHAKAASRPASRAKVVVAAKPASKPPGAKPTAVPAHPKPAR
jgi:hypothetical protein